MAKRKSDGSLCEEKVPEITTGKAFQSEYLVDWKIENFRMINSLEDLIAEQKLSFVLGDFHGYQTKWSCALVESRSNPNRINIFLNLLKAPPQFKALVNFSFQTIKPNGGIHKTSERKGREMVAGGRGVGLRMIRRNEEELEELIWEDGSIVIRANLKLWLFKPAGQPNELDVQKELNLFEIGEREKLSLSMTRMMEQGTLPEAGKIIKVVSRDGLEFYANTATLSARSPVLDAMFTPGRWKESKDRSEGDGGGDSLVLKLSGKTVKVLLHFLMLGALLKDEWKAEDVILELTFAAGEYQLQGLTAFLDKVLPAMNFGTRTLVKLTYLTNILGMKNAEDGLFSKLKEAMSDIQQMVLDKQGDLFEDN